MFMVIEFILNSNGITVRIIYHTTGFTFYYILYDRQWSPKNVEIKKFSGIERRLSS